MILHFLIMYLPLLRQILNSIRVISCQEKNISFYSLLGVNCLDYMKKVIIYIVMSVIQNFEMNFSL